MGSLPPNEGEVQCTAGLNTTERASVKRVKYHAQVAGLVQVVDTVCLSWKLPQSIIRQSLENPRFVELYTPLCSFGTVAREEYLLALRLATIDLFTQTMGPVKSQLLMYNYVSVATRC